MYIFSEKTNAKYNTVEECIEAEKKYDEEQTAIVEKKAKLSEERKNRAKEIEDVYQHLNELVNKFIDDYGAFHLTFNAENYNPWRFLNWLW